MQGPNAEKEQSEIAYDSKTRSAIYQQIVLDKKVQAHKDPEFEQTNDHCCPSDRLFGSSHETISKQVAIPKSDATVVEDQNLETDCINQQTDGTEATSCNENRVGGDALQPAPDPCLSAPVAYDQISKPCIQSTFSKKQNTNKNIHSRILVTSKALLKGSALRKTS